MSDRKCLKPVWDNSTNLTMIKRRTFSCLFHNSSGVWNKPLVRFSLWAPRHVPHPAAQRARQRAAVGGRGGDLRGGEENHRGLRGGDPALKAWDPPAAQGAADSCKTWSKDKQTLRFVSRCHWLFTTCGQTPGSDYVLHRYHHTPSDTIMAEIKWCRYF